MNKKRRSLLVFGACLLASSSLSSMVYAEEEAGFDRAIEYRQSVMTILGWHMKPMGTMIKGKIPFDQATFSRHAKDLAITTSLDLLSGFPEDSDEGETDARADIWLDFEDFQQKFKNLQNTSRTLSELATGTDQEKIKAAFGQVGKACKACHKAYKD